MRPDKNKKVTGFFLILICYAAFVSLFIVAAADAFNTDPYHFLQLQG